MNEFIDKLLPLEHDLFLALNGSGSAFWDDAMWTFTGIVTWIPIFLFILYITFRNQQAKEAMLILLSIVLVLVLANITSSLFFKPLFKRYRPTYHPSFIDSVTVINDFRGGHYGFISGHATNSFALALLFTKLFRNKLVTGAMFVWAILTSYSRIYLGVHFISDILGGILFGIMIGQFVYYIYRRTREKYYKESFSTDIKSIYNKKDGTILGMIFTLYIIFVILFSPFLVDFSHSLIPEAWF